MAMSATGVAFTPFETRVDTIVRLARQADALGLDRVQVAEAWSHDATVVLAEVATETSRIGLGTGVISVWGRKSASIALAAAGLQRVSGGRFSLGQAATPVLPATVEELAREVTMFGTYDELPELIRAWRAAGADSVQLVLPPGAPEDQLAELVESAASAERVVSLG